MESTKKTSDMTLDVTVDLNGLQSNLVDSYNRLVKLLKKSKLNMHNTLLVDGHKLEKELNSLHNDLIFMMAVIDPTTGKSGLDGKEVGFLNIFSIDDDDELQE